jgi:hypothetical protein
MIDAEVIRLRSLRRVALLTRRLAAALQSSCPNDSVFSRSGVAAWSIARLINGRLKSHPNLDYQRGQADTQTFIDHSLAAVTGWVATKQGRAHSVFTQQLQILARELQDTRALTWSADLGDDLGRAHWQLLRLLQDLRVGVTGEAATEPTVHSEPPETASASSGDWPYIAL